MPTPSGNDSLISMMDAMFKTLCEEASLTISDPDESQPADTGPKIGFIDRLKLFESGTRWVAVRNKIDPGGDDDAFGQLRRGYGNSGPRRSGPAAPKVRPNGAAVPAVPAGPKPA